MYHCLKMDSYEEAKCRIDQVEDTLDKIARVKEELHENATEVKNQIHSMISRQLESLRNREVWLLNQVELIKEAKEETLINQQAELNQALGGLRSTLEYSDAEMNIDPRLSDVIERLNETCLKPAETSMISFKADTTALRKAIHRFGKVDSRGLPSSVVFADPRVPSKSLPQCFEDYDDAEHHIMYKTVEDLKMNDRSIHIRIPRLSQKNDIWLAKREAEKKEEMINPLLRDDKNFWLLQTSDNAKDVQQWLHCLKDGGEMEDETSTVSDSIEILSQSEYLNATSGKSVTDYFRYVQKSPKNMWLLTKVEEKIREDTSSKSEYDDWFDVQKDKNKFCRTFCSSRNFDPEIESLEDFKCTNFAKTSKETNRWLMNRNLERDLDMSDDIVAVCKANELCDSVDDCCCTPNCMVMSDSSNASEYAYGFMREMAEIMASDNALWLSNSNHVCFDDKQNKEVEDMESHDDMKDWLMSEKKDVYLTNNLLSSMNNDDINYWLHKNDNQWLSKNDDDSGCHLKVFDENSDYEKWLISEKA